MHNKKRTVERILNIDIAIAIFCMAVLVGLTFVGAIMRYFVRSPIVWQEEVQTWMIIWVVFCGGSYAFRKGAHIAIDVLTDTFSATGKTIVKWFGYICTTLVLAFFFYYSLRLNIQFIDSHKLTMVLRMPTWIVYIMASVGSAWMIISATYYMFVKPDTENEEPEQAEKEAQ